MREQEQTDRFVELLTQIQVPLLLYVRSLMPGEPAVRDVVQNTNATIWQKHHDFELGTNFKAWAFSIARYEVLNHRKQQARDGRLVFSDDLMQMITAEMIAYEEDTQSLLEALQRCLNKLRPQDRDLIDYRYAGQGNLEEYARKVGRSAGGLKVSLHRLRNTLLACIQRQSHAEGGDG